MILTFFSAYFDEDYNIQCNHKTIALSYLKSWFIIDIMAIFPFWIFENIGAKANINGAVRIAKVGRLWKLVKLTRVIRVIKLIN